MNKFIEIKKNKTLRLDNVLIKKVFTLQNLEENNDELFKLDAEVVKMDNEIRSKGAQSVGPLIQYSGVDFQGKDNFAVCICLMIQSNKYINNISQGYEMKSYISIKNCLYTRFTGLESDLKFAYQKIQLEAYENDIELKGDSYTIFVDSGVEGTITADVFMETIV